MLRRLSTIAAATAMLALSALPASAATMPSSTTHKISFPSLYGVSAWGTYQKTGSKVKVSVCAEDTVRSIFAVGAVTMASNASSSLHQELGAVDIGYHQTVCRSETLRYTAHLKVWTFTATNAGRFGTMTKTKSIY